MSKSLFRVFRTLGLVALFAAFVLAAGVAVAADAPKDAKDEPILVFGHINPDSDSVAGAIAAAHLWNARGMKAEAVMQGPLSPEAAWVLKKFNLETPRIIDSVAGKKIGLVDFSDAPQGPKDIAEANLVFIVDHHKLGGLKSTAPLEAWILPVGSTNTVLFEMYNYYGVPIPKDIAGAMLSAILSDTVIFKSVTCTPKDKAAAEALAKIAGVTDMKAQGIEQFNVKSDFGTKAPKDLVTQDYKDFTMNGKKVGVGQLEVVDLKALDALKPKLVAAMTEIKKEKGQDAIFLMLTDIMQESTMLLAVADNGPALVKKAWNLELKGNEVWMPGVMSRKKQIIPQLEAAYK